jgi:hypothetical protein
MEEWRITVFMGLVLALLGFIASKVHEICDRLNVLHKLIYRKTFGEEP